MKTKLPLLALLALALTGCNDEQAAAPQSEAPRAGAGEAIAYVNGEPISERSFQFHLERRTQGQPERAGPEDREVLLNELVDMTLLAQEASRAGLQNDPTVAARLENLRTAMLAQAEVEKLNKQAPDEAALQAEYEKRFGGQGNQEYHARHILVDSQEKAQELIAQLDKGADFAKLAQENSTGPTGPNGGDLGWFQPEQMVPAFADAVKQMEPGSYSKQPVQTRFGWHVIKLEETRAVPPPSMDEVRQQLQSALTQQRIEQHIEQLRTKAEIRFAKKEAAPAGQNQEQAAPAEQQPAEQAK